METAEANFTDPRDGKVYKTIKIGKQTWMAENLNYDASGSKCYNNDPANSQKYGRLYDWKTAKKVCPPGWHLPSDEEWQELVDFAGGKKIAGKKLRAKIGWNGKEKSLNGPDEYGFAALPGGRGTPGGNFDGGGYDGHWWGASESDRQFARGRFYHPTIAYCRQMFGFLDDVLWNCSNKNCLLSVRCVQD